MSAYNTQVSVSDPDRLIAGDSPYADFEVTKIQLYRWTTEALARAGSAAAGTLVTTFTLIASTEPATEAAGPFSFKYNDTGQASTSWYRYRFTNTAITQTSGFSYPPNQADSRTQPSLREILFETANLMDESAEQATATAGSTTTITSLATFGSSLREDNFYTGHWAIVLTDAGGAAAAPEGEEAMIASDVASTGVLTLERALTAAIASGDVIMTSAYLRPTEIIRCINRAREGMKMLMRVDIAVHSREALYPVPVGVRKITDVYEVLGVTTPAGDSNADYEAPIMYSIYENGPNLFFRFFEDAWSFQTIRVVYEMSYYDYEGPLVAMGDTTNAPLPWLRAAAAAECMEVLTRDDSSQGAFVNIQASIEKKLAVETMRAASRMPARKAVQTPRGLPGPRRVR